MKTKKLLMWIPVVILLIASCMQEEELRPVDESVAQDSGIGDVTRACGNSDYVLVDAWDLLEDFETTNDYPSTYGKVRVKFFVKDGSSKDFIIQVVDGGWAESVKVNTTLQETKGNYITKHFVASDQNSNSLLTKGYHPCYEYKFSDCSGWGENMNSTTFSSGTYNYVTLELTHVSNSTKFIILKKNDVIFNFKSNSYKRGLLVTAYGSGSKPEELSKGDNTIRVVSWNIQYGMWYDQPDNYENFTNWLEIVNPDVCIFQEACTRFDDTGSGSVPSSPYLPTNWGVLASTYDHTFAEVADKDPGVYHPVVTVKVKTGGIIKSAEQIKEIGDDEVVSTGGYDYYTNKGGVCYNTEFIKVTTSDATGNKVLYFVPVHLWVQLYSPEYACQGNTEAGQNSAAAFEGPIWRDKEVATIMNLIKVKDTSFKNHYWYLMGDFNSISPEDEDYYNEYGHSSYIKPERGCFDADMIVKGKPRSQLHFCSDVNVYYPKNTGFVDTMHEWYSDKHDSSGYWCMPTNALAKRLDMVYASEKAYGLVSDIYVAMNNWVNPVENQCGQIDYVPSDHRPVIIDIDLSKAQ